MSDTRERLLDTALEEHFGAGPAIDLPERILAASRTAAPPRPAPSARRYVLQAAGLAAAAALIGWVVFARGESLPETVKSAGGDFTIQEGGIEARSGWYVLERGAPAMRHGGTRVEQVTDRVLVKTGEIPDESELAAMQPWLAQLNLEEDMRAANWVKAGGVALCLLAGSVTVDGNVINAQAMERKRVRELEQELEVARKKLAEAEAEARRQEGEADTRKGFFGDAFEKAAPEDSSARQYSRLIEEARLMDLEMKLHHEKLELAADEERIHAYEQSIDRYRRENPDKEAPRNVRDGLESARKRLADRSKSIADLEAEIAAAKKAGEANSSSDRRDGEGARGRAEAASDEEVKTASNRRGDERLAGKWVDDLTTRQKEQAQAADAIEEIRKLLNDKDVELATLRSRPEPDAKRIREVEVSMAALQKALEALQRQNAQNDATDETADWTAYTVLPTDSWWKIAHVHFRDRGLTSDDIQEANPGVDLMPGAKLKIPRRK